MNTRPDPTPPDPTPPDRGFMLTEISVAMMLVGVLLVPVSTLIVTVLRSTVQAERRATTESMLTVASSLISRVPTTPCSTTPSPSLDAVVARPSGRRVDRSGRSATGGILDAAIHPNKVMRSQRHKGMLGA